MDRSLSSVLGRPCAIQDHDIDADLPIECDDEYWINDDPSLAFKQPEGKPSTVTFFNCALRLMQINVFALRTVYSINKSKALLGFVGPQWEQFIVAELDSTMNRWIDSVPDHLRWDPHMENLVFLSQSAHLYASYYALQITVHRPYIPSPRKPSGVSFPSLAICTNAARSCIHVLDVHAKRTGFTSYMNQMALFSSGIVLLLNIWGAKRSGSVADPVKEMKEVHKAMNMLKTLEPRWYTAGQVWDILYNLANVGDLPLPKRVSRSSQKRTRDSESPRMCSPSSGGTVLPEETRHIAGTRRVQQYKNAHSNGGSGSGPGFMAGDTPLQLPLHSDELGRLPLHPFFDTSMYANAIAGSKPSMAVPPVQAGQTWFGDSFGTIPGPAPQSSLFGQPQIVRAPTQARQSADQLDAATFEAMFSMISPASYRQTVVPSSSMSPDTGRACRTTALDVEWL
ncbi:hypothetical protein NM688_g9420 [Phlebia brevispora]|uniref:Uncharacterized protein n=1 Tax=Phlebia brevispora TaxID=194682 RepID=A0ACC1RIJ3_9APHY|nr:hypothetical protein NM688_g9420 [Phlebia brevispora]